MRPFEAVFRRELAEQARRPLTILFTLFMVLQVFMASRGNWLITSVDTSIGGQKAWVTSEFSIAYIAALIGFFLMAFFVGIGVGMPLIRDDETNVGPLLHSTPLSPRAYVWAKFLAGYLTMLGVLAVMLGAWVVFAHGLPNPGDPEIYGPFSLGNYLRPMLVFVVPSVTLTAAGTFLLVIVVRRAIALFALPLAAFFAFNTFIWGWYPPEMGRTAANWLQWLDPSGFRWLKEHWLLTDRGLGFYNTEPIAYDGAFLLARVGWVAVGAALVWFGSTWFEARLRRSASGGRRAKGSAATAARPVHLAPGLAALGMSRGRPASWRVIWVVFIAELRELRSRGAVWLFLGLVFYFSLQVFNIAQGPFHTDLLITSGIAAAGLVQMVTGSLVLLLLFYVADLLHREEATGFAPIFRSLPVSTGAVVGGKMLAVGALALGVTIATLLAGLLTVSGGAAPVELWPFVLVFGLLVGPTAILWVAYAAASYGLTGTRAGAYGLGLLAIFATFFAALRGHLDWVTNWSLTGVVVWSDISWFEVDRRALVLNRLLAVSLAALLFWVAVRSLRRRVPDRPRLPLAPARARGRFAWAVPAVLVVTPLVIGGLLASDVANGFQGEVTENRRKRYWRENLATWIGAPSPVVTRVDLDVDLEPAARGFRVDGSYELENRTSAPMARFAVTGGVAWSDLVWSLDGVGYEPERREDLYVVVPPAPLAPGDRLRLGFSYEGSWPIGPSLGQAAGAPSQFVLPSGVLLNGRNPEFVPVVGYLPALGVDEENQYEPEDAPVERYRGLVEGETDRSWFDARLSISAPADFTVNATGVKVGETSTGDRKTVIWESDAPIRVFNLVGGRWERADGELGTSVFYDARHAYNVDVMVEALDGARRHFSRWFHPYPWRELRLNEFPGVATYAMGNATNILFSENVGFLAAPDDRSNSAFAITAHEAAHSWFGHIVGNGEGPGGIVLSEGGAHFATLMLLEEMRGPAARQRFARTLESAYGQNRQPDTELPLVGTTWHRPADGTVIYDRGAWVFWMLMREMGREPFLAGMREYFETFYLNVDHPLVPDLVEILRRHAADPEAYDAFVEQWLYDSVIPEFRVAAADARETADGWATSVRVLNAGTGKVGVDVAVTLGRPFDRSGAENAEYRVASERVVIGPGKEVELEIASDFDPERIVVDPDLHVLQLERRGATVKL